MPSATPAVEDDRPPSQVGEVDLASSGNEHIKVFRVVDTMPSTKKYVHDLGVKTHVHTILVQDFDIWRAERDLLQCLQK